MARVYYGDENIQGEPFESKIINLEVFDYILDNTNEFGIDIPRSRTTLIGMFKKEKKTFQRVRISSKDGINYKTREGDYYLPNTIIFYDINDYTFPTEFYFIAKIKKQLEIRQCNGGKDVEWHQIPNLHSQLTDEKIIEKIENSVLEIKKLVETKYNKQSDIEKLKLEEEKQQQVEENRKFINLSEKNAYLCLTEICLSENSRLADIKVFFDTLKNYENDENYYTTLNFVMEYLEEKDIYFFMRLDWKSEIEELEIALKRALKDNFNQSFDLPSSNRWDKNDSVSADGVFKIFDDKLEEYNFQISLIDTNSDEYVLLLHQMENQKEVKQFVQDIGYKYTQFKL